MTCDWHVHIAFAFSNRPYVKHFYKSTSKRSTFALILCLVTCNAEKQLSLFNFIARDLPFVDLVQPCCNFSLNRGHPDGPKNHVLGLDWNLTSP